MKSKLLIVVICTLLSAVILVILVPVSALPIEGSNISGLSELHKVYPSTTPAPNNLSPFKNSAASIAVSGSKYQAIQEMKNQTFTPALPAAVPGKPQATPTPVPTPGYSFEPSKYTDGLSMKFFTWRASSENAAVQTPKPTQQGTKITSKVTENGKKVTQANNQFAIDLYTRLANDPIQGGKNLFFSPWSLSTALAITYEGARGDTATEIQSVFHFPPDNAARRTGFYEIISGLNRGGTGYTLRTANALWAEKTYPFLPEYTSTARNSYSASVTNLDFINNPEDSRTTINKWVAQQTADRIQDLLPSGSIDSSTRLVITNAIYFKGTWDKQFSKDNTIEEEFLVSPLQTVRVPMMKQTDEDAKFWYTETDSLQVLGMPYAHKDGKELTMLVLLPKDGNLESAEQGLTADKVSELQQALVYKQVMVYFPKFIMETKYSLPQTLSEMGMPGAFTSGADFSGMDGTRNLFIDDVIHQAFIDVNEEGTEAAAATAVGMSLAYEISYESVPVFRADHPFIFIIQDNDTGNILFMGRVTNPADG